MIRWLLLQFGYAKVGYTLHAGRLFLMVNGYAVAMQGDKCRDADLLEARERREPDPMMRCTWDMDMINQVLDRPGEQG